MVNNSYNIRENEDIFVTFIQISASFSDIMIHIFII